MTTESRVIPKPAELGWWDWTIFLLHTVAEIEHALLVQYLYAAYSVSEELDTRVGPTGSDQWRHTIVDIARQEMGHLLTEQNILRFLGGPLNLEREDFPFRSHLYPFPFVLEPLSKNSLAKYVAAEMPAAPDIPADELAEILARAANASSDTPVNRVGTLFDTLVDIFSDPAKLPDTDFRPQTADDMQARPNDWQSFWGIIVRTVATREEAIQALSAIGEEGEGMETTTPLSDSHFSRFLTIYRQFPDSIAPPPATALARNVPVNPNTVPKPAADPAREKARITHPNTLLWAQLFNLRYRMLLVDLAHAQTVAGPNDVAGTPTARGHLTSWTFAEMSSLRALAGVLVTRPLKTVAGAGAGEQAGPPFELPYTLALPDDPYGRWRLHRALLDGSGELVSALVAQEGAHPALDDLTAADAVARVVIEAQLGMTDQPRPGEGRGEGSETMNRFDRVVRILDDAIGGPTAAIGRHGTFWRGVSRDQFVDLVVMNRQLLVVGDGAASNLVKSLRGQPPFGPGGVRRMPAGLPPVPDDQIDIIEQWIDDGCPADPPTTMLTWRATNAPMADQSPGGGKRYDDVWFVTADLGWAANSDGKILRTTDGGTSWEQQFHDPDAYFRCLGFASDTHGWAGTSSGSARLLHTNDGQTWNAVEGLPADGPQLICGLSVVDESIIYASGTNYPFPFFEDPPALMKTIDGAATWTALDMTAHASLLVDIFFTTPERGWVVGGKADPTVPAGSRGRDNVKPVVLFTEDGGSTWVDRVAGIADTFPFGEWGWKIQFIDDALGFVCLENFTDGAILKTTDGGQSWHRLAVNDPQGNANLEGIGFLDENHGWVGGWGTPNFTGGFTSATTDGGASWNDANEVGKFINRFRFLGDPVTVGYAAGATVYKYAGHPIQPPPSPVAPAALLPEAATEHDGGRQVRIPVTVPDDAGRVRVNVWGRFGRPVATVLDEADPAPGPRTVEWDTADLDGTYIVRVTVDDESESQILTVSPS